MKNTTILGLLVLGSSLLLLLLFPVEKSEAATSLEYACLQTDTGQISGTLLPSCITRIEDTENGITCYVTPQGGIDCLELRGR